MFRAKTHYLGCCAALAAVFLAPNLAHAIGPQYQYVGDGVGPFTGAPVASLNEVVRLQGPSGGGTGTVIGVTAPDANGTVSMAILTANHVAASGVTSANFGVGPGDANAPGAGAYVLSGALNSNFQTFKLTDAINNPNNLPEDMSVMLATVYKPAANVGGGAALAEYNLVTNPANTALLAGFFPSKIPALNTSVALTPTIDFTQVGQGQSGTFDPATSSYIAGASMTRRYENNTLTGINGNSLNYNNWNGVNPPTSLATGYFQPTVDFKIPAPNAAGGGDGLPGDSGSPLFIENSSGFVDNTVTPKYFNGAAAPLGSPAAGVAINVPIQYTNTILAVFVGYTLNTYPPDPVGLVLPSVPLVATGDAATGSLDWALYYASNPKLVPEPGSIVLIGLGGGLLLLCGARRQRARAAQIAAN